jgi:hypothetical protein
MFKRLIFSLITVVLLAGLAIAHGDPITGTVTAVGNDTVTITNSKDNKPLVLMLVKDTKYVIDKKPAKKADLKVGVRVVIDAEMDTKMKMYNAEEIQIGAAAPAAPAKPAPAK